MIKNRINGLLKLKNYLLENSTEWMLIKEKAERENGWFVQEFIEHAIQSICSNYLDEDLLNNYANLFAQEKLDQQSKKIGIIMAGNIPLVGFHDFLTVYLSGNCQQIKFSSKDNILLAHIIKKLIEWDKENEKQFTISDMLKNCDAYMATGSNQSSIYFEKYFAKYPHIIRNNKTSVAVLKGNESVDSLEKLADDVYLYFGLGCRNITKIYVPQGYDFIPLLNAFKKYDHLKHHNKYRNNLDYNLAVYIINHQFYMSNESILLLENKSIFSNISVLNYEYYSDQLKVKEEINQQPNLQLVVGHDYLPFGSSQTPSLIDFADGMNTIEFLNSL